MSPTVCKRLPTVSAPMYMQVKQGAGCWNAKRRRPLPPSLLQAPLGSGPAQGSLVGTTQTWGEKLPGASLGSSTGTLWGKTWSPARQQTPSSHHRPQECQEKKVLPEFRLNAHLSRELRFGTQRWLLEPRFPPMRRPAPFSLPPGALCAQLRTDTHRAPRRETQGRGSLLPTHLLNSRAKILGHLGHLSGGGERWAQGLCTALRHRYRAGLWSSGGHSRTAPGSSAGRGRRWATLISERDSL